MLDELQGSALMKGARGSATVSASAIIDVLLRLGGKDGLLMQCAQHVAEVDINPLIVNCERAVTVDARFVVRREA